MEMDMFSAEFKLIELQGSNVRELGERWLVKE